LGERLVERGIHRPLSVTLRERVRRRPSSRARPHAARVPLPGEQGAGGVRRARDEGRWRTRSPRRDRQPAVMPRSTRRSPTRPRTSCHNAGLTRDGLFRAHEDEQWNAVLDTNLPALFRCSRAVARAMMKARYGRIVNVSSVVAHGNAGRPTTPRAKAGSWVHQGLARELASRSITVNAVCPVHRDRVTAQLPEAAQTELKPASPRRSEPRDVPNGSLSWRRRAPDTYRQT